MASVASLLVAEEYVTVAYRKRGKEPKGVGESEDRY